MSAPIRIARVVAALSALTALALFSGTAPAAATDEAAHPFAVLAPITGAFAENGERTEIDRTLDAVVLAEAANVIGQGLDQADTILGQRGTEDTHSEELVLQCRPDTGTCDEVDETGSRTAPTAPRG